MKWHLHITVKPHWSWVLTDVASALQRDVERHGVHPVVITNHFHDSTRPPYRELIPSMHLDAPTESDASREIFKLGVLLNNAGWRVKRLKIEGNPEHDAVRHRALYFETHLKNPPFLPAPRSTNARGDVFYTIRRQYMSDIHDFIEQAIPAYTDDYHVEAAVLDTNPAMDNDWINQ